MGGYNYKSLLKLQVQSRRDRSSESIPGLETPETGAGTRTRDQMGSSGGSSSGNTSGGVSSDTNQDALPKGAGSVRSGVGFGGVRNVASSGTRFVRPGGAGYSGGTKPGLGNNNSNSNNPTNADYVALDASKRDTYLTGAYGLTSLYPSILLTSPRTAKSIDTNTDLSTTPFIIDLNNEIKKTVEKDVRAAIDQNAAILQLTTTQYDQNVQIANQYAELCLQASLTKDRIIKLTNLINVNTTSRLNQSQNITIDGKDYQFLKGRDDVLSFMESIHEELSIEDFTEGSSDSVNTKALVQTFKILYNQFLLGDFYLSRPHRTYRMQRPNHMWGQADGNINEVIQALKTINDNVNLSNVAMSYYYSDNRLTDLVRIIQRDLIMQASKDQVSLVVSSPANTSVQNDLGSLIGKYKDDSVNDATLTDFNTGYSDISDFTAEQTLPVEAVPVFVKNDGSKRFNVLDVVGGHDYLLYDELSRETNEVNLDNLTNFSNSYSQFAIKLRLFYQLIFRDDEIRRKCLSIIAANFISFFDSSISKAEFTSKASGARMGILMAASNKDIIAKRLFEYICNPSVKSANDLLGECEKIDLIDNNGSLEVTTTEYGDGGEGRLFDIDNTYLTNSQGTSFGMFHSIADEVDSALSNGKLNSDTKTDKSLNLSRNARAFVFYQLFLNILKRFDFRVYFDKDDIFLGDRDEDIIEPQIKIEYKPAQAYAVKFALENYVKTPEEFDNSLKTIPSVYRTDAKTIYDVYLDSITRKINDQEQNCLDIVNLLINHSAQIAQEVATLKSSINEIKRLAKTYGINDKESIMNSIQSEQAFLKKNLVDRYKNPLRGAAYLPSAIDHNVGQAINVKTVVATLPVLNDPVSDTITRKFLIAVGIPTGLLESLRYQNTISTSEHLYSIDLVFKNLQVSQQEEDAATAPYPISRTFSSRIFVNEGYQLADGPDVNSRELTNYDQIYAATKYKVIDEDGNYRDASPADLELILGSRTVVENHLLSHYAKLLLKTTSGITFDEEAFDLVPQTRRYPDASQDANYTTIVDRIATNYPDTPEGRLNKERVLRDLSRAIPLAPEQHKISMMVSKIFERIHVIPVDIDEVIEALQITNNNITFLDVVVKIRLEDSQPPMTFRQSPTRRSYTQAVTDAASAFRQTDISMQSADKVGLNKMAETSKKFSGIMGGRRR